MIENFRAWHKKEKKMSEPFSFEDWDDGYFIPEGWNIADMIIMQSTGLKDKNGKGVFEGDIVCCYKKHNYQIVWSNFDVGFRLKPIGHRPMGNILPSDEDMQVIGNIHENPELLEVKK